MIARIFHIAKREWLEQVRQPTMLGIIAALYGLVGGIVLLALLLLQVISSNPASQSLLGSMLDGVMEPGAFTDAAVGTTVAAYGFLIYSQFLGISAVLAGHGDMRCYRTLGLRSRWACCSRRQGIPGP